MQVPRFLSFFVLLLIAALPVLSQDYPNIEFIENKGQWDKKVKFKGKVNAGAFFIRSAGFSVLKHNEQDFDQVQNFIKGHQKENGHSQRQADDKIVLRSHGWDVDFIGASPKAEIIADKPAPGVINYFIGNDPSQWAADCKVYQGITVKDIYPNVDVRYYTSNGMLKYDIIAKPGADISKIALKYKGLHKLAVKNKELVLSTSVGEMRESFPYTYQLDHSAKGRTEVNNKFVVNGDVVRFDIRNYDRNATLVIDPTLIFCSFSGSAADNWGFTATYGPDGSFFGGGIVFGDGFPFSTGAFQTNFGGGVSTGNSRGFDMGIIKLSSNGSRRVYATYIGGDGNDQPHSLIVDGGGNLYLAGRTNSSNFPATSVEGNRGGYDIVVAMLNPGGSALISSVVSGKGDDGVNISIDRKKSSLQENYGDDGRSEVMLDGGGNVYVASCTQSDDFPVTANAFQKTFGGGSQDGVVLKFSPRLASALFISYLGGNGNDAGYVLSLAPGGDIYVGGGTESDNLPGLGGGIDGSYNGNIDGFVSRISNSGSAIIRSIYLGTGGIDQVYGLKFDRMGFPYVMGTTTGSWPIINAVYSNAGGKQFIAKLQPDLSAYIYSTVYGTNSSRPNISPTAFLVDRCENVYVSGWGGDVNGGYTSAGTAGMPLKDPMPYPPGGPDGNDFHFFVLKRDAADILFGSFFGQTAGQINDHVDGGTSRFDDEGVIYQAVCANCGGGTIFPTTPGAWATTKPSSALCNLGMIKIAFNLAGVGSQLLSEINGIPGDTAGCVPLDITFIDLVRNAKQYIWSFGDGSPDVGPLPAAQGYTQVHTYAAVGTYQVRLIAIDSASCNVSDTSYLNIKVSDNKALLNAQAVKLAPCEAFNYRFDNLSTATLPFNDSSFLWDFGDGSPLVKAGLASQNHTYAAPGTYLAKLILNDTSYCNYPDTLQLTVRVAANVEALFVTPPTGCAPYLAVFENTSMGGETFSWNFGDPSSGDNTSSLVNPTHLYSQPGVYTVTMIADDPNTCNKRDTTTTTITVLEKPTAAFSYTPAEPVENTPNVFYNESSVNSVRFKWLFGDGDTLATDSRAPVTHQYNAPGTYNACLIAYNEAGCPDTTCLPVTAIVVPALDVPNAFTPNTGGVNSIVKVRGFGIAKMQFTIWNRWGQKVFESNNINNGWDGRVKGAIQPMDVYAYTLDVEFFDGTKARKKGDITLIR